MRLRIVSFLIVLGLLAVPLLASAAGPGAHAPSKAAARDRDAGAWANLSESAKAKGLSRAENAHLFAKLTYANGTAAGRFVSFGLDNATGVVTNYAVLAGNNSTTFFASVTPDAFNATDDVRVTGSILRLYGENATLKVHNNPLGLAQWNTADAGLTLTFALAANVTAANDTANNTLRLTASGIHAHLILPNGSFAVDNGTVTATMPANATLLFAAHPANGGLLVRDLHAVRDAAGNGTVGAIVSVAGSDEDEPVDDAVDVGGVSAHATHARNGTATIHVSGDSPRGKAIVIHLDNATLPGTNVTVMLDNQTVHEAALGDALRATGAAVNVTRSADGVTVVVAVPHFSDHDIVLASTSTSGTTTPTPTTTTTDGTTTPTPTTSGTTTTTSKTPGFGLVALVGAAAVVALLLRRRG